jgi:2,3-bisphosphoglycerate-independent phosphoglycerate mutase
MDLEWFQRQVSHAQNKTVLFVIAGGDHSTPSILKSHSWHPVPIRLHSNSARGNGKAEFGESA